ncbi:MAG: hypothetical protein CMP56_04390 [Flavobacteriales bacterium]|jgi:hypothetical protein|nr:hypothetical protein [Flavobacteriales bacterium]|tara:strand:+ start:1362 stop:1652 length:291 start_codon:yes stop_codon:yes gene_type:complete
MIIYSIEICLEKEITQEWLSWMKSKHIPDVMKTNLFIQFKMFKNIDVQNTYTIQYELNSMKEYLKYEKEFASNLQKEHIEKFKGKFQAKRRLLNNI